MRFIVRPVLAPAADRLLDSRDEARIHLQQLCARVVAALLITGLRLLQQVRLRRAFFGAPSKPSNDTMRRCRPSVRAIPVPKEG